MNASYQKLCFQNKKALRGRLGQWCEFFVRAQVFLNVTKKGPKNAQNRFCVRSEPHT